MNYLYIKNKKGLDYGVMFSLVVLFALFYLFVCLHGLTSDESGIGYAQLDLLSAAHESEKILFYIDQSAENAFDNTVYDLMSNGGFYKKSGCGIYKGYSIWQTKDKKCYPNLFSNFNRQFSDELNDYLQRYR